MLSAKQGGIKYHFLSLWYDLTWDWTPVSRTIGKHSTHLAKNRPNYCLTSILLSVNPYCEVSREHHQNKPEELIKKRQVYSRVHFIFSTKTCDQLILFFSQKHHMGISSLVDKVAQATNRYDTKENL